jgi:hypothetical protein
MKTIPDKLQKTGANRSTDRATPISPLKKDFADLSQFQNEDMLSLKIAESAKNMGAFSA